MSYAKEDWKFFFNMSGQAVINDALGDEDDAVYCSVLPGEWVAMCEYDDDNSISQVIAMHESLSRTFQDGRVVVNDDGATQERSTLESDSGVMFIADRRLRSKPPAMHVPDEKLNPYIVDEFGRPDDEGKSPRDSFVETCFHLARDYKSQMPTLGSFDFGTAFDIKSGSVCVDLLYNGMRDVIGLEISRKV